MEKKNNSLPEKRFIRNYAGISTASTGELFDDAQMQAHALMLAEQHVVARGRVKNNLSRRLKETEKALMDVRNLLSGAAGRNQYMITAAEWLLDNFYVIENQIRRLTQILTKSYTGELPLLASERSPGLLRVYDIASELLTHSKGQLSVSSITGFIKAYQTLSSLQSNELRALPFMLQMVLLENLQRITIRVALANIYENQAIYFTEKLLDSARRNNKFIISICEDMCHEMPVKERMFTAALIRRLRDNAAVFGMETARLEERLCELTSAPLNILQSALYDQVEDRVGLKNHVGCLRMAGSTDWREFLATTNIVDEVLSEDIPGVYRAMDFLSRDTYCRIVENIARRSPCSEHEIACMTVEMAKKSAATKGKNDKSAHVGYYLLGNGRQELEKLAGMRPAFRDIVRSWVQSRPVQFFLGNIFLGTLLIGWVLYLVILRNEKEKDWLILISILLALPGASQLAVNWANRMSAFFVSPSLLPRIDFSENVPPAARTLVVIPALISNVAEVQSLVNALEVRFLGNRLGNLHFALLTDFKDAPTETLPEDESLLQFAAEKITELNIRYGRPLHEIFFLFHRPRRWNSSEGCWMGQERKRGKLVELNALLRGASGNAHFSLIIGAQEIFPSIRYVITLDADTQLPPDTAWKLIGTISHPLNQAIYNEGKDKVLSGYGMLQPRIGINLPETSRSLYIRMQGSIGGIDPYTRVTSDVYQDLFGEGSFIGKGIFDVDIYAKVLDGRFPENSILSHDLLEGCYMRSGLVSDVQLFEEYPTGYEADTRRHHRWIRGDWQLLPYLLPRVPSEGKGLQPTTLSVLSRWKIFDNLRRSLVPSACMLSLLFAWAVMINPGPWTLAILGIILFPSLAVLSGSIFTKPSRIIRMHYWQDKLPEIACSFSQSLHAIINLPFEAFYTGDAILRTMSRLFFTRKRMLEWNPSGEEGQRRVKSFYETCLRMWICPVFAIAIFSLLAIYNPTSLKSAWPLLLCWFIAPFITWWISLPPRMEKVRLPMEQHMYLRRIARRTWSFFEDFVDKSDNWLPPDYYQEFPVKRISHRTSPTNMGLSLLANLAAFDFGYITLSELIARTERSLHTMILLQRYKGHFFNWYDTHSLRPVKPLYISTVDSCNLVSHLLVLRRGLLSLPQKKIFDPVFFSGLSDTFRLLKEEVNDSHALRQFADELDKAINLPPARLQEVKNCLESLARLANNILDSQNDIGHGSEGHRWVSYLVNQSQEALDELTRLAPWLLLPPLPPGCERNSYRHEIPTWQQLAALYTEIPTAADGQNDRAAADLTWSGLLKNCLQQGSRVARERIAIVEKIAALCMELSDIDYGFLYNKQLQLLLIGYNVEKNLPDNGCYDLLASEARVATFMGIAQGKLSQECWFTLGRPLAKKDKNYILLSWSGSMFEYLMPLLVMPSYKKTLLDISARAVVRRQINYGKMRGVPWGISECAYNEIDINLAYQYGPSGVPGLGLQRGIGNDLVIAPYASMLALMIAPFEASCNLQLLSALGLEGKFGFFESIDYTSTRGSKGNSGEIVRSFMIHHQGMGFLSLAHVLLEKPMQQRFESEPLFKTSLLLLQERTDRKSAFTMSDTGTMKMSAGTGIADRADDIAIRVISDIHTPAPEVQLLSNGRYHVMVTNAGGGYSKWKDLAVTRWREDGTRDNWGMFCYIRNIDLNTWWSPIYQPTQVMPEKYNIAFSSGQANFSRWDGDMVTEMKISVSPEDDVEIRRITIKNNGVFSSHLEITSYAEVLLTIQAEDVRHPAFSNLFVQTEIVEELNAIFCHRRPRSSMRELPWLFHSMQVHGASVRSVSYETDRLQFIGRCHTSSCPQVIKTSSRLSGTQGAVLDPIVAIQYLIDLPPASIVTIDILMGVGENRQTCEFYSKKYRDRRNPDQIFPLARTHSQAILNKIRADAMDISLYGSLAGAILYPATSWRADGQIIAANRLRQAALWNHSISGDLPVILLRISDPAHIEIVEQLVKAHQYWQLQGLYTDLVICNENRGNYHGFLQTYIQEIVGSDSGADTPGRTGNIVITDALQIPTEDHQLLQAIARVVISDEKGTLAHQVGQHKIVPKATPRLVPVRSYIPIPTPTLSRPDLLFFNETGGFTECGKEYVISTSPGRVTPMPWSNVIANPHFGTVVSESGQAYTWMKNAHEFRLTPWNNDPVTDSSGETFYIRDEEDGHFWSPTPLPAKAQTDYLIRHGFGYSVFECNEHGIYSEMRVYVDIEASVKYTVLKIRNLSDRERYLSITGYAEWILGSSGTGTIEQIITEVDEQSGALLAKNHYSDDFADIVCFFDTNAGKRSFTTDRREFIGRNGCMNDPDGMTRSTFSGRTGAGLDPCAAIQAPVLLGKGDVHEIIFLLGAADNAGDAGRMAIQCRNRSHAHHALEKVFRHWQQILGKVQIKTPDYALNILSNGWLLYQTLSSRLWGRSGYYQSTGCFGFRDQLQDVLAIMHAEAGIARNQILLCASRQFKEGDVLHWWHPPAGRGLRTRCSDDSLWLPFVTLRYISRIGDSGILDEMVPFLEGGLLGPEEESCYSLFERSSVIASLYEHCRRAIRHSLTLGDHGLPPMGTGDWNDSMDKVETAAKGESVWVAFFLYEVLTSFSSLAFSYGDPVFSDFCTEEAEKLRVSIDRNGWNGSWYERAYSGNVVPEDQDKGCKCIIESVCQSWAVLSGAAPSGRSLVAMESAYNRLVCRELSVIKLLDPAFSQSASNPSYIASYFPGIKENGGQYTTAAIWMIMAFAKLGHTDRVGELLTAINPVYHSDTAEKVAVYKTEPYVMAADIYSASGHNGRGGWTWYTGSAGWMYQLILESICGLIREGNRLRFSPCIPDTWESVSLEYKYNKTIYHISIINIESTLKGIFIDSEKMSSDTIDLVEDNRAHFVTVYTKNIVVYATQIN